MLTPAPRTPAIEPPDVPAALATRAYPGTPAAVVRYDVEMSNTAFMAAYPWSAEHGWSANN
jgi:hypothetical protein